MPIDIIYLVVASSGMYDDRSTWNVAAFLTLEAANAHRDLAQQASEQAIEDYKNSPEGRGRDYVYFDMPTAYDLAHRVFDTRVNYRVEPVPLVQGALSGIGLMAVADAFSSAQAVTRELAFPGISQKMGKPKPAPVVEVKSAFADKLLAALTPR